MNHRSASAKNLLQVFKVAAAAAETIDKTGAIMLASTPFFRVARSLRLLLQYLWNFREREGEVASREIRLVKEAGAEVGAQQLSLYDRRHTLIRGNASGIWVTPQVTATLSQMHFFFKRLPIRHSYYA